MIIECHPKLSPYQEVIDVINKFPTPPHFFNWLAQDKMEFKVLIGLKTGDIRESVYECRLNGVTLCTLGGHLNEAYLPSGFKMLLVAEKNLYNFLRPEMESFKQKIVSYSIDGSNYSVICEVYYKDICCGSGWEVFDLALITEAYNSLKDR